MILNKKSLQLAGSLVVTLLTGFIGSLATQSKISTWYESLEKPWFTPPDTVFGPVWTLLYILMAVSLYLVIRSNYARTKLTAYLAYSLQLGLNLAWTLVFFGLESPLSGLVVILLLMLAILWNVEEFFRLNKLAAYLLVPYLAWVIFATALNGAILGLNA